MQLKFLQISSFEEHKFLLYIWRQRLSWNPFEKMRFFQAYEKDVIGV